MNDKKTSINNFRKHIQKTYISFDFDYAGFDEILCYELHSQPVNPRMRIKTRNNGFET